MRAEIFHAVNDRNGVAFDVAKHDFVYESSHADSITCLWLNMKNVLELGIPAKSTFQVSFSHTVKVDTETQL